MGLLTTLKSQTAERHLALETQMDITRHFATVEGCRELLEGFFGIYEPLEQRLAAAVDWSAEGWDFDDRRKTPWLRQDLRAFGLGEGRIEKLPRCTRLPEIAGVGAAVGCLYVLEGSTLGGQVITKLLNRSLHVTPETGGRFFAGYQDQTGPRWKEFGTWAESLAGRDLAFEAAAVTAAGETFECFERWFVR